MAINDIVKQFEPLPGLLENLRPSGGGEATRTADHANSEYRRALSRSLDEDRRTGQKAPDAPPPTDRREPAEPTESRDRQTTDEPTAEQPARQQRPDEPRQKAEQPQEQSGENQTESNKPDQTASPATSEQPAPDDPPADADIENQLPQFEVLPAIDFAGVVAEAPVPPADFSQLFGPPVAEPAAEGNSELPPETGIGDRPPAPPSGLFQSLVASAAVEQGDAAAEAKSESTGSKTAAATGPTTATAAELGVVDVIATEPQDDVSVQQIVVAPDQESADDQSARQHEVPAPQSGAQQSETAQANAAQISAAQANADRAQVIETKTPTVTDEPSDGEKISRQSEAATQSARQSAATASRQNQPVSTPQPKRDSETEENKQTDKSSRSPARSTAPEPVLQPAANSGRPTAPNDAATSTGASETDSGSMVIRGGESVQPSAVPVAGSHPTTSAVPRDIGPPIALPGQPDVTPQQFVDRVSAAVKGAPLDGQQMRVRLSPPHLGPLHISVNHHDGAISVRMEVQSAAAHSALQDNLPLLRDALVQQGSAVERIEVQLVERSSDDSGPDFNDRQQRESRQQPDDDDSRRQLEQQQAEADDSQEPKPVGAGHAMDELDIQV